MARRYELPDAGWELIKDLVPRRTVPEAPAVIGIQVLPGLSQLVRTSRRLR